MIARFLPILLLAIGMSTGLKAQEMVTIHGQVTDFKSNPIDSATVSITDKNFEQLYTTQTGADGRYSLKVPKGRYYSLWAINFNHYGKTKLEYWAWNIPAYSDLEINPQYDRMEVYGVNVFEPKVGPFNTYMIYFRPMSLTKSLRYFNQSNKEQYEKTSNAKHDTTDMAPKTIIPDELTVKINDKEVKILQIQKLTEYGRGSYNYGYIIQVQKEKDTSGKPGTDRITVILHSNETNESGRSDCFYEKPEYTMQQKK
ncbi:carboxypeptidase-like regulatory domain-containing protein [uncultured Acetobacteroides sp.]|uniref:carboxypeptidase-like regulatory domain-containing protein n=1 Tax=uncultured Acetobacteroides sp. TaxID=1760811 RepID=UPI0029F47F79|nr:carboxypeptidase-like regulatory domain-containing protein [uncultured Acetobacteroides sp.]